MVRLEEIKLIVGDLLLNQPGQKFTSVARNKLSRQAHEVNVLLEQGRGLNKKLRVWWGSFKLNLRQCLHYENAMHKLYRFCFWSSGETGLIRSCRSER